ncbi:hypothetical protein L1887_04727 [Cichorium endivia]|nr:hypothetical protein L1887_04727 [Cichorium endivia]
MVTIPSTSFHDAVPAVTPAGDTHSPINPTVSDVTTSANQEHTTTTSTPPKAHEPPRRNPLRRTLSDIISTRLRRMEEIVSEIEQDDDEDKVRKEFVGFKRLDGGGLSIKLSCSCGNCYEFLSNRIGCYYRIDVASVDPFNK